MKKLASLNLDHIIKFNEKKRIALLQALRKKYFDYDISIEPNYDTGRLDVMGQSKRAGVIVYKGFKVPEKAVSWIEGGLGHLKDTGHSAFALLVVAEEIADNAAKQSEGDAKRYWKGVQRTIASALSRIKGAGDPPELPEEEG